MTGPVVTRRPAVLAAVLVAVLALGACSGDAGGDDAAATPAPSATQTITQEQVDMLVASASQRLNRAVRQFDRCDGSSVAGYGFNSCWPKAVDATEAAAEFAATLRTVQAPAAYDRAVARLVRLGKAGAVIRKGCRTRDDQTCDQALMRFRNDVQQASWELELL